ncbi:TOP6B-like family protein [Pseudonocardia humida]|uniref:MFS transporter n=1 Tax=Pseudonocardia humida TaxID=2800819 RepID=A0ABT1A5H6_9PSEU|nr:TOP6B-like family protein [Pseudonocardia humida]MCO1658254.1 hypothetical protein [Pseudonocardia humida]
MTAPPLGRASGRRAGLLAVWVLATMGGLLVASTTKIGPVVLSITRNHGVHQGDLVGFGVCYGAALLATLAFRPRRAAAPYPTSASPRRREPPPTALGPAHGTWAHGGAPRPAWAHGGGFGGAEAPTERLHPAVGGRQWYDAPTRPIRPGGTPHPDDRYGRRAG